MNGILQHAAKKYSFNKRYISVFSFDFPSIKNRPLTSFVNGLLLDRLSATRSVYEADFYGLYERNSSKSAG